MNKYPFSEQPLVVIFFTKYSLDTTSLSLSHKQMDVFPREIFQLTKLMNLNLQNNYICAIPLDISKFVFSLISSYFSN